jgi:hypothetical protein
LIQKLLAVILLCSILFSERINLNNANSSQLEAVGFTPSEIKRILEYRSGVGYFETVYDLLSIDMEIEKIHTIRKDVSTELPILSTFEKDIKKASYKLGKWISNEGNSEGLSEIWLDKFFEPQNVNNIVLCHGTLQVVFN